MWGFCLRFSILFYFGDSEVLLEFCDKLFYLFCHSGQIGFYAEQNDVFLIKLVVMHRLVPFIKLLLKHIFLNPFDLSPKKLPTRTTQSSQSVLQQSSSHQTNRCQNRLLCLIFFSLIYLLINLTGKNVCVCVCVCAAKTQTTNSKIQSNSKQSFHLIDSNTTPS